MRSEYKFKDYYKITSPQWSDSCPFSPAVKSARAVNTVTKENWRSICSCQRHRALNLIEVHQLRGPFAALVFMAALVLVGSTFPIEAMNLTSLPTKFSLTPSEVAARSTTVVKAVAEAAVEPAEQLHLLSERVKEGFLDPAAQETNLMSELVKEEFFRSEIPFGSIIYREARRNGLKPELVAAVVKTESDFRPTLLSNKNAHGLMQLIPSTGALMGARDLFNPAENVRAGAKYLRYLQGQFKDPNMVLAAYNAGESVVRKYNGIPPYPETQNYVKRVAENHERFESLLAQRMAVAESLRSAIAQ